MARSTDAIAVVPPVISDRTCTELVGLEPRTFRDLVRTLGLPTIQHGRRLLVRTQDFLNAFSAAPIAPVSRTDVTLDDEPTSTDEILARAGLQRSRKTA